MFENKSVIAIDGPAASGKSSVSRRLAERIGALYLNTGNMYRAITWYAMRVENIDISTACREDILRVLEGLDLSHRLDPEKGLVLLVNGSPAPPGIRSPEVAEWVSRVSAMPDVRAWLVERQRKAARHGIIVVEGRDIGTVVFPDAACKFFLTASPEVRAVRRLEQEGETARGATVESVAREIAERDRMDSSRKVAPLKKADDAVTIDSSDMSIDEVLEVIMENIEGKI